VETTLGNLERAMPQDVEAVRRQDAALVAFSETMREQNLELKRFLRNNLYRHYRVHRMTSKASRTISALFSAFIDDPRLMPYEAQGKVHLLEQEQGDNGRARAVADYIAGMTDRFAIAEYERTFNPSI
jgi:dGTPase